MPDRPKPPEGGLWIEWALGDLETFYPSHSSRFPRTRMLEMIGHARAELEELRNELGSLRMFRDNHMPGGGLSEWTPEPP